MHSINLWSQNCFFKMFLFCILELNFDCVIIIFLIYQICTYLQNIPNCIHLDTSHLYGSNFVHLCSVRKSCCSFPHTIHSHKLREKRSREIYQFMDTTFYSFFLSLSFCIRWVEETIYHQTYLNYKTFPENPDCTELNMTHRSD